MKTSPSDHKTCTQCNRAVPLDGFYKWGGKRAGRMAECKDCFKARTQQRWPDYRQTSVAKRKALRAKRRAVIHDSYLKELICWGGGHVFQIPVSCLTPEMIELKRLEVTLRRYSKEVK